MTSLDKMATLARERCLNHDSREAVGRCPSCRNFFCRECVVLFEARLSCATCLAAQSAAPESPRPARHLGVAALALTLLAVLVVWLLFYLAAWSILEFREHAPIALASAPDLRL